MGARLTGQLENVEGQLGRMEEELERIARHQCINTAYLANIQIRSRNQYLGQEEAYELLQKSVSDIHLLDFIALGTDILLLGRR
jgi:hypothetical protein